MVLNSQKRNEQAGHNGFVARSNAALFVTGSCVIALRAVRSRVDKT